MTSINSAHFVPLTAFYDEATMEMPQPWVIDGDTIPEPYKTLLVNNGDMTPTLEKFHKAKLHLKVLGRSQIGHAYRRQVLLLDPEKRPVEFGAIRIHLDVLLPEVQRQVLAGFRPLGGVLIEHSVKHTSKPSVYFAITGDDLINNALGIKHPCTLYGRCNTLTAENGQVIAEVVEVLPPHQRKD
jgi:chorismate-pyruvate lyase